MLLDGSDWACSDRACEMAGGFHLWWENWLDRRPKLVDRGDGDGLWGNKRSLGGYPKPIDRGVKWLIDHSGLQTMEPSQRRGWVNAIAQERMLKLFGV